MAAGAGGVNLQADVQDLVNALRQTTQAFNATNIAINAMMNSYSQLTTNMTRGVNEIVKLGTVLENIARQAANTGKTLSSAFKFDFNANFQSLLRTQFRDIFNQAGVTQDIDGFIDRIMTTFGSKLDNTKVQTNLQRIVREALGLQTLPPEIRNRAELKLSIDLKNFVADLDKAFNIMQQDLRFKKGIAVKLAPDLSTFSQKDQDAINRAIEKAGNSFARGTVEINRANELIKDFKAGAKNIEIRTSGEKQILNSLIQINSLIERAREKAQNIQIDQAKFDALRNALTALNINPSGSQKISQAIENLAIKASKSKLSLQELQDILNKFQQGIQQVPASAKEAPIVRGLEKIRNLATEDQLKLQRLQEIANRITLKQLEFKGIKIPPNVEAQIQPFIDRINNALAKGLSVNQLQNVIDQVRKGAGTTFVGLEQEAASAVRGITKELNKIGGVFGFLEKTGKRFLDILSALLIFDLGRSTILQFSNNVKQSVGDAIQFGIKVAEVQTIAQNKTQATTVQFRLLSSEIANLAAKMGQPLADVTEGLYETFSNQVAKGTENLLFMEKALEFSKATVSSTADSVNLLTGALTSFNLNALNTERVAAIMFKTIELGRIRANELAPTFGRIGNLAATLNIPIEELAVAMQVLTIRGVTADEAMTLLNNIMLKLLKPTEEMQKLFDRIGVSTGEAAINAFGFKGVLQIVEQEAKKGSKELAALFNELRALRGAAVFSGDGMKDFNKNLKETINSSETYKRAIDIILTNSQKQLQIELNKVNVFLTKEFGIGATNAINSIVKAFGGLDNVVRLILGGIKALVIVGGSYVAVVTLMGVRTIATTAATRGLATALTGLTAASGVKILLVGLTAALIAFGLETESTEDKIVKLEQAIDNSNKLILEKTRQTLKEEQDRLRVSFDQRLTALSRYTTDAVRLSNRAAELSNQAYKKSADGIKTQLQSITDALQKQISDLESAANKAEQFVEQARQAAFDRPGQLFEKQIDQAIRRLQRQEQQLLQGANPISSNQIKADTLRKTMDLVLQDLNRLSLGFNELRNTDDFGKLEQQGQKLEARILQLIDLQTELQALTGGQIPEFNRPKVMSFDEKGRLKDATDDLTKGNTNILKLGEAINAQNLRNISGGEILRDLAAERERIEAEILRTKEQQAFADRLVAEEQRKLLRDSQKAIDTLTSFNFKRDNGDFKSPQQIRDEVNKLSATIREGLQDAPVADKLAAATKLQELETNIFRNAEAQRTKIAFEELQARQNVIRTQLQSATQDLPRTITESNDTILNAAKGIQSNLIAIKTQLFNFGAEFPALFNQAGNEIDKSLNKIREATSKGIAVDPKDIESLRVAIRTIEELIRGTQVRKADGIIEKIILGDEKGSIRVPFPKEVIGNLGTVDQILQRVNNSLKEINQASTARQDAVVNFQKLKEEATQLEATVAKLPLSFEQIQGQLLGFGLQAGSVVPVAQAFAASFRDIGENLREPSTQLGNLNKELEKMIKNLEELKARSIKISVESVNNGAQIPRFALGGPIRPVGTDNMLAMFNRDEFIVNARNTRRFFPQLMSINRGIDPTFNSSRNETTNVGDIHIHVNNAQDVNAKTLGKELRRAFRRGKLKLR